MACRPSDTWRADTEQEAAELAAGTRSPDQAYARTLWPRALITRTDAALAAFEADLAALLSSAEPNVPDDHDILTVVQRAVLALNAIHQRQVRAGRMGYETGEREQLCDYIDATLTESGLDTASLEARNGRQRWELTDEWRDW